METHLFRVDRIREQTFRESSIGVSENWRTPLDSMETQKMSTIPVELPDDLLRFVEARVQRGQFASASEYIVALVDAARSQRSEIEAALIEGLRSGPAEEWSSQDWVDMKQRVVERHHEG
jgi:putative addiction module CopG family antidote